MKTITVTEMVEMKKNKYQANDGKMFDSETECYKYECGVALLRLNTIETCRDLEGLAPFDGQEHMEYHDYRWFKVNSEEDLGAIDRVTDGRVSEKNIGKWLCLEMSDDSSWAYALDDMIEYAKTVLDKLGYDMVVTERRSEDV